MGLRDLFGIKAANEKLQTAAQPMEAAKQRPWGAGAGLAGENVGITPPWHLGSTTGYWVHDRWNNGNNQGSATYNPATPGTTGPQGSPVPFTDPALFYRVGNGYPGVLPDQCYDSEINNGPAPSSYRRYWDCRLMDSTPNRIGGGSSGGNAEDVVLWSLAGQLYGRPPGALISQPSNNQTQGVSGIPSIYARRTVG